MKISDNPLDFDLMETIIIYNALTDDTYLASIIDTIKPNYFQNTDIKNIIQILTEYYTKRNAIPNLSELKLHAVTEDQKRSLKSVLLSFKQINNNYNKEELYANTEQFFKNKALYDAIKKTVNEYSQENSTVNTNKTLELFEDACGISLVENLGRDYFNEIDEHIKDLKRTFEYISTGYKWVDKKLGGGFLKDGRSLYIFSGVTNSGKSIVLGNIAANILKQNKTVIIISLEMSESIYSQRISGQLTQIPLGELKNEADNLKTTVGSIREKFPKAKLFIKEYPPKSITVNTIKAYIKKLIMKKKIKPNAIIVDYVNLVLPTLETGNTYIDVKAVAEQLRALSYIFECPVISATQLHRNAFNTDNPGLETTSESMGLAATADFQACIWSTESDKEMGIIHLGLQKNRFGQNFGSIALKIDYNNLSINEIEDEITENTQVDSAEQLLNNLK